MSKLENVVLSAAPLFNIPPFSSDRFPSSSTTPATLAHANRMCWIFGHLLVDVYEPISISRPFLDKEHRWYDHDDSENYYGNCYFVHPVSL
jgi:hypothetical protein